MPLKKISLKEENYRRVAWTGFKVRKEVTVKKNVIDKEQVEESLKKKMESTHISFADLVDLLDFRELIEKPSVSFPKCR